MCVFWRELVGIPVCRPAYRLPHPFPLGISFYTFQAISYLTEIYWQEEEPEKSLPDFMIYMLFFMKFLSGPIERAGDMLPQLKSCKATDYASMVYGMRLIVVGLIKKLILADSIAPYIDGVFGSVYTASGVQLLMACLLYPIELYADFSGYTDIALGGARMLGFKLSPTSTGRSLRRPLPTSGADGTCRFHSGYATICTSRCPRACVDGDNGAYF